jgi:replicative DNA helicase
VSSQNGMDRLPPYAEQAEAGALGACLASPACIAQMQEAHVVLDWFYDSRHRALWQCLTAMDEARIAVDMITVFTELKARELLEAVGGISYVSEVANACPSAANLMYYVDILRDQWILRRILSAGSDAVSRVYAPGVEVESLVESFEKSVFDIAKGRAGEAERAIKPLMQRVIDQIENYHRGGAQLSGLPTGFGYVDKMLCGLHAGQMVVIAARPGDGKTSFIMQVAMHVAVEAKRPVAVFSLEMSSDELVKRMVFTRAGADFQRWRTGFADNSDMPRVCCAVPPIAGSNLWIDDTGGISITDLRARARRMVAQYGIQLIVVDYLQLMTGNQRYGNREAEVADVSRKLKALAKELNIPILIAAQLNRDVEKDKRRRPRLADIRESGSIEQDADVVMMLWKPQIREEVEAVSDWSQYGVRMDLEIVKQRSGPTGTCRFIFRKACTRFEEFHGTDAVDSPPVRANKRGKEKLDVEDYT